MEMEMAASPVGLGWRLEILYKVTRMSFTLMARATAPLTRPLSPKPALDCPILFTLPCDSPTG